MGNIAATLSLNVPAITALCKGARGSTILTGSGVPSISLGLSGDYYIDVLQSRMYGPKTNDWLTSFTLSYPASGTSFTIVSNLTSLISTVYGNNSVSGNFVTVLGGENNTATGINIGILGGSNNSLSGNNTFIIGSNITANLTGYTLVNNLSTPGSVFTLGGNSNNWNNVYTSWNATSATLAYTLVDATSSIQPIRGGNTASGCYSIVGGGQCNIASGNCSFIAGGANNDTRNFANTFILGSSLSATATNFTYVNNLSSQGVVAANPLRVGNSQSATVSVGSLANKIEVFNAAGVSLGFIPVYTTIT
jgi:hypothetical protein